MISLKTTDGDWHIFSTADRVLGQWDTMLTVFAGRDELASFAKSLVDRWIAGDPRTIERVTVMPQDEGGKVTLG